MNVLSPRYALYDIIFKKHGSFACRLPSSDRHKRMAVPFVRPVQSMGQPLQMSDDIFSLFLLATHLSCHLLQSTPS